MKARAIAAIVFGALSNFVAVGAIYGFEPIGQILVDEGIIDKFSVVLIVYSGVTMNSVGTFASGFMLDRYGSRPTFIVHTVIFLLGGLLFWLAYHFRSHFFPIGYGLMGFASAGILNAVMPLSTLAGHRWVSETACFLTSFVAGGYATFMAVAAVYHSGAYFRYVWWEYLGAVVVVLLITAALIPRHLVPLSTQELLEGSAGEMDSHHQASASATPSPSPGDGHWTAGSVNRQSVRDAHVPPRPASASASAAVPLLRLGKLGVFPRNAFLSLLVYFAALFLPMQFYLETLETQVSNPNLFNILYPSGVVVCIVAGPLIALVGFRISMITSTMALGLAYAFLLKAHQLPVSSSSANSFMIASFVFYILGRNMVFAVFYSFASHLPSFGRLTGTIVLIAAVMGTLTVPLAIWSENSSDQWMAPDIVCVAFLVPAMAAGLLTEQPEGKLLHHVAHGGDGGNGFQALEDSSLPQPVYKGI